MLRLVLLVESKKKSLIIDTDSKLVKAMPYLVGSQHKAHQLIQESQQDADTRMKQEVFV